MTSKGESSKDRILSAAETRIMQHGFAGTSIDDILKDAALTKGAFFHHFKGKADLARELVERHAIRDIAFFAESARLAEEASDDPLEQIMLFMKRFEDYVSKMGDQPPGCIYAVYTYESMQFDSTIHDLVADTLREWTAIHVRKFHEVLERYEPAQPVTARELGEMAVSVIEGGFVLARAYGDGKFTARQSEYFRKYLTLLFAGNARKAAAPKRAREKVPA